jgi:hypothetical protein
MSRRYDPGQITHPLDVAKSAALVGGASGTYTITQLHISVFLRDWHITLDHELLVFL